MSDTDEKHPWMGRTLWILCGAYGASAVLLGAFGAHGLKARLMSLADADTRLGWWETAAHYHLIHALALGIAAYLADRTGLASARVAGWCLTAGVALFSGSLYTMTVTGVRWLGAITPLGGLLLIAGWLAIAWTAWRMH